MQTNSRQQPQSVNKEPGDSKYPYNNITQTESGHTFEMDDTPGKERVRIHHGTSESFVEFHPDGTIVIQSEKDIWQISAKDKNVVVKGQMNITVYGDAVFDINGDKIEHVKGDCKQIIDGNLDQVVGGDVNIISKKNMYISADPGLSGVLSLGGGSITMPSSLNIEGELTSKKITSKTRIEAGEGMMAGKQGYVTHLGGIAVGTGAAVPGTINASVLINCMGLITSPSARFGTMNAVLMTDIFNKTRFNTHSHPSYRGPTGSPSPTFV